MKKKLNFHIKNKHWLPILIIICISLLVTTFASDFSIQPLREGAGYVVVPFEKGMNQIGSWVNNFLDYFRDAKKLADANEELEAQIEELEEENYLLSKNQKELERLQELYQVDQDYSQYDKVLAKVIAKDPGNWYTTFTINKGTKDGISVDMNVIAAGGLVGIVTETGAGWAEVRTIIDDESNISAMTLADSNTCVVSGDLTLMDSGKIKFSQLWDETGSVCVGENLITSHISDKYLDGILIGTISSIEQNSNNLTYSGYLIPAVDFRNLQEVLVITQLKEQKEETENEE